ncbi:MAG: bifunctional 5,10-methylenetetrahydrofolate dehydrogenase/5,10-methenyltetrahydrofolate cyclohydrolase [Eggerthellaceae bacterium]|nr:bifunctional 5,10-methylenetetrahydrofolate dehydrogenase/5,10-methenyltetrahydrofolate cyclohydrolase [Eggerthellaceae bacterium]
MAHIKNGIIDGNVISEAILNRAEAYCAKFMERTGKTPCLELIEIGEGKPNEIYKEQIIKKAERIGAKVKLSKLDTNIDQEAFDAQITAINKNDNVHACMVFQPLPKQLDPSNLSVKLCPYKDIDGITITSIAALQLNNGYGFAPCTAQACIEALNFYDIDLEGKKVAIIGRSNVVGKPLINLFLNRNATPTVCHSKTLNIAGITKECDIIVCATGRAKMFGPQYFAKKHIVIDVGINWDAENNCVCGDVDFEAVKPLVKAIAPVPGGIGPITSSLVASYIAQAAKKLE